MRDDGDSGTEMTARAAEAFAAYVGMGPGRSLRGLAHLLAEQNVYKNSTAALRVLAQWSVRYRWQERLAAAITAKTEEALAKAAEIDAQSFLRSSELIAARISTVDALQVDAVIKMRETVRRPEPKTAGASVNLNLSVTLRAIVERVAAEQGLDADAVLAEAEQIIAAGI